MDDFVNAIKSPDDPRDYNYELVADLPDKIPEELDLRNFLPPVRSQGSRGTCVAFTVSAIKEYQENLDIGFSHHMSPEFVYFYRENKPQSGMFGRDAMKILHKRGIVPEFAHVYGYTTDPSDSAVTMAKHYRIKSYARIYTIEGLKKALFTSGPCYISFPTYKNRPEFWRPKDGEERRGGHAVAVVGYNKEGFILRNSWGRNWNGNGHVIYPYDEFGAHWEIWSTVDIVGSPKINTPSCLGLRMLWKKIKIKFSREN